MNRAVIILTLSIVLTMTGGPAWGQFITGGRAGFAPSPGNGRIGVGIQGSPAPDLRSHQGTAFGFRGGEHQIIIQQTPPRRSRQTAVSQGLSTSHSRRSRSGFMVKEPHFSGARHRHPHRHLPHAPGILIIEVPRFRDATVSTEIIPGRGWADQPIARPYSGGISERGAQQLAPFDPTPQEVVERMLVLAGVKKGDVVYDLGSGDGRVVVSAAKTYGVNAVGVEIDPGLVKLARENVREHGVEKLVEIRQQDFLSADLSEATVVTLYLSYDGNLALRPKLMRELKPGARVVSYIFDMGDWPAKIAEAYRDAAGNTHMLYLWQITEPRLYGGAAVEILR